VIELLGDTGSVLLAVALIWFMWRTEKRLEALERKR
jgi:hypothetical protein